MCSTHMDQERAFDPEAPAPLAWTERANPMVGTLITEEMWQDILLKQEGGDVVILSH